MGRQTQGHKICSQNSQIDSLHPTSEHNPIHNNQSSVKYQAYFLAFISNVFLIAIDYFVKQLTYYYPSFLILGYRGTLLFISNSAIMKHKNISFDLPNKRSFSLMIKRSTISAIAMTLYLAPLQFIPIGIANTLYNTSPIMTFFIEALYYKNTKIRWGHVFLTCISFFGVIMIIQPGFLGGSNQSNQIFESILYVFILVSSFLAALSMMIIHDLGKNISEYCTLQYYYIFQGSLSFVLHLFFADAFEKLPSHGINQLSDLLVFSVLIISLILSSFIAHYTNVRSAYLIKPSYIMPFSYVSVIIGILVDVILFKSEYNLLMIVGALFASCGLLIKLIVEK